MNKNNIRDLRVYYGALATPRLIRPEDGFGAFDQIVSIRHGQPVLERRRRYTRKEAEDFMLGYDRAGVDPIDTSVFALDDGAVPQVYTSTLPRAYQTAEYLFADRFHIERRDMFIELERQVPRLPASWKLPIKFWQISNRALYFAGKRYKDIESFTEARLRILEAASLLEREATTHGAAVLVAHGLFNHFLWRALKRRGWTWLQRPDRGYLGVGHYLKPRTV